MIITMRSYSVNFKLLLSKVWLKCSFSVPHTMVWPDTLQLKLTQICYCQGCGLLARKGQRELTAEPLLLYYNCLFLSPFLMKSFSGLLRFCWIPALGTAFESRTALSESTWWNLCSPDLFNTEEVIDSSWFSYISALAIYTRLFLCKVLLQGC